MKNHHEYTIYQDNSAFYDQGWTVHSLAQQVTLSVAPPIEILLAAYDKCGELVVTTTVLPFETGGVLASWFDHSIGSEIDRVTWQISPHMLDRWIEVGQCNIKPIPNGVYFDFEIPMDRKIPRRKRLVFMDAVGPTHWANGAHDEFTIRRIYIPSEVVSERDSVRGKVATYDKKSSSKTVLPKAELETQSDLFAGQSKSQTEMVSGFKNLKVQSEHELRALGTIPNSLFVNDSTHDLGDSISTH